MSKFALFAVMVLLLAACAEQWQKPGASEMDFEATRTICTSRANMRFPPRLRQIWVDSGFRSPIVTRCYERLYSFACRSYDGYYFPPRPITIDENAEPRHEDVRACLFENGWRPVS